MLPYAHVPHMRASETPTPAEQLRLALLDLQEAHRHFVRNYARPDAAELAAKQADDARTQAARWGALVRATDALHDE